MASTMLRLTGAAPIAIAGARGVFCRHGSWRAFTSLPIIDIGPLLSEGDAAGQQRVAQQLHAACRDVGFFYVKNHDMRPELQGGVLAAARQWFALPASAKEQILLTPGRGYRGYQPLGSNVTRYQGGFQRDWHEAIDLFREDSNTLAQAQGRPTSPIHAPNQWPHQLPLFDALLRAYLEDCLRLGAVVMRGIALGLGLEPRFFESRHPPRASEDNSYWVARVLHYPPLAAGPPAGGGGGQLPEGAASAAAGAEIPREVQLSCGEHTDYGLLTFVNQEPGITALQVKNADGAWIDAAPIPGTFVCNIGDMLERWSGGQYRPTLHRVVNTDPSRSRVSLAFFYEPAFEAVVEPIAGVGGARPDAGQRYPPVRYGSHLESKVLTNFELEDLPSPAAAAATPVTAAVG